MLDVNTDKLLGSENDKWQTRPLVKKSAPQRQDNFKATFKQKIISGLKFHSGLDTKTYWLAVSCKVTTTSIVEAG
jgi:hypothetical protein